MLPLLKIKFNLIILLITLVISSLSDLHASDTVKFSNVEKTLNLGSSLLIYEDSSGILPFNKITTKEFKPTNQSVPNLGISKSVFWIKINILNNSNESHLMLELASPIIDNVEFYYKNNNVKYESIKIGEALPFYIRKYKDPNYLFDVLISKGNLKTYYLKISSNDMIQLPVKLGSKSVIYNQIKNRDILSGIYLGIMLVMILYNLFVYFSVKDTSYLYYVVYILLVLLVQTGLQGYFFQYLWYDSPRFAQYSIYIFPSLVGIAGMAFMNVFLKVSLYNKLLFKFAFVLSGLYLIPLIAPFFGFYSVGYHAMNITAMLVSIYMLITVVYVLRKGYTPAKYFLIAWVVFLLGVIVFILKDVEVLPFNDFTRYTMQIGSGIETVLLSFALAARINIYKKERLEALQENEKIIREQNVVLEEKVEERTTELNQTLIDLKETQSQLVDAEKMSSLGQLTAGIAHEINNPINFVSSNITPLRQDIADVNAIIKKYEEIKDADNIPEKLKEIEALKKELDFEYLKTELDTIVDGIEDGAKRTTEIVSGLRNFARLDEGESKKVNINQGLESTIALIKNKLNGIKINTSFSKIPDCECNPGKINQLAMNLIDNAIYAIDKKDIENKDGLIEVITDNNDSSIILTIKDNGVGINDNIKDKLFDPFFTTKDVGEGTGLGLSIVRSIIETHKGKITVNSTINKGTEMIVEIPIKRTTNGED